MPGPGSSKAPSFNGETSELLEFLELFEDLASSYALTDADKCKMIVRYVNIEIKRFWVTLTGYESKDFTVFKTNIIGQYPGAAKGARYTIHDLERVILNNAESDISTETELVQYYHQFRPIAVWLVVNSKISEHERDRYFWQGLPQSVRLAISQRLQHTESNYSRKEATNFEKVVEAGRFVLSDDAFDADLNEPIAFRIKSIREARAPKTRPPRQVWDSDEEEERRDARREVQTKRVAFTPPTPVKSKMDELDELASKMHGLDIADTAYSVCYTRLAYIAPTAAQAWATPKTRQLVSTVSTLAPLPYLPLPPSNYQANATCFFCGGSHVMRTCSVAGEYLRAGRIIRDGQYFAFPDRSRLRRFGNETFKQAIDARYSAAPPSTTPATGSNAIPVNNTRQEPTQQPPSDIPSTAFISESYFLQCEPVVENHAIVTVENSSDEDYQSDANAVTRSKAKASSSSPHKTNPESESTKPLPNRLIEADPKSPAAESKKPPAFTYESKAALPDAIQRVFKGILDITVPHLTVADLLAISPELRKETVEHCRTHRVPASTTAISTNASVSLPPAQVERATPLREIRVTLNGIHSELGLLDEGSEIVVIREDVWKKTMAPINPDARMRMQTANGGSQEMAGCVEMLEIEVEGIKTWAHAYVVPNAP